MRKKWKEAVRQMKALCVKYSGFRRTPIVWVHTTLMYRSLDLLYNAAPQNKPILEPFRDILALYATAPDDMTDYEFGRGKHYYCAVSSRGIPRLTSGGYYKNGIKKFAPSARTQLETDYTMALTMYHAGFTEKSAEYLSRAAHFLGDICCLPHAACWTYFSAKKSVHVGYEDLARIMYPDSVRTQTIQRGDLRLFLDSSFRKVLNGFVKSEAAETAEFLADPEKEIKKRLLATERALAALLHKFCIDISLPPEKAHYIADGMLCRPFADMPEMEVSIKVDGVHLLTADTHREAKGAPAYSVTHIRSGLFTLAHVREKKGRVVTYGKKLPRPFTPRKNEQLFTFTAL